MPRVTPVIASKVAKQLGLDTNVYPLNQWAHAMQVELEHGSHFGIAQTNVTKDDMLLTGKIALAHILEYPDYYQRLAIMEEEAELFWANKEQPKLLLGASRI